LFVLNEAGGDYRQALALIRAGKKALSEAEAAAKTDDAAPDDVEPEPAKPHKAPPMPGGGTQRAPRSAKRDGNIALSDLGIR
jgi:hypothetical protein